MPGIDEVMSDLSELIQDAGFEPGRFKKFGTNIMKALGTDDPFEAMSVVEGFVHAMGEDKYTVATRYALGIFNNEEISQHNEMAREVEKQRAHLTFEERVQLDADESDEWTLTERRKLLSDASGQFNVSEATLRRWEKVGLQTLAGRIVESSKRKPSAVPTDLVAEVKHLRKEVQELKGMIEQLLKLSK